MLAAKRLICWNEWKNSSSRNVECVAAKAVVLDAECHYVNAQESRFGMH